ncbi:hypothetical protein D9M71_208720 [compost metagenome]
MRQDHGIDALVIEQRRAAKIVEGQHLADQYHVVAAIHLLVHLALETRRAVGEQRRTADTGLVTHPLELVVARAGELIGEVDLVGSEDVHREVAGLLEHRQAAGTLVNAPEDQRRLQGDRVEAVGGDARTGAIGRCGGDYGDASGEIAQGTAEGAGIEESFLRGHGAAPGGRLVGRPRDHSIGAARSRPARR